MLDESWRIRWKNHLMQGLHFASRAKGFKIYAPFLYRGKCFAFLESAVSAIEGPVPPA